MDRADVTEAVAITPRLYMGPLAAVAAYVDMIPVSEAGDALTVIRSGHSALLAPGSWDLAAEILRSFGATEDHIDWVLGRAGR